MKSAKDPRHIARILAAMDLYNFYFDRKEAEVEDFNIEELELGNHSKVIRQNIVNGIKEKSAEIDEMINKFSTPVKTSDLDLLQLQIIRSAIYEGFVAKSIPPKVAVDEAIEIVRDFGMETSAKKIGGILGKIFDNLAKKD
jgi:N utilization substance protein B